MGVVEKHKRNKDGELLDGVDSQVISDDDREAYRQSAEELSRLSVPVLLRKGHAHDRLLFVMFDGTGNDVDDDPEHATSIGTFRDQIEALSKTNSRVDYLYLNGPGTQHNVVTRTLDGALGYSFDERVERMYRDLMLKASDILDDDPEARISIVNMGFSRGAELASRFSRIVHERGIQNIDGMIIEDNVFASDVIRFTKPASIAPGRTPQAIALFDPVGTGFPHDRDRHLPPSVLSGLQIVARDEKRNLFPSSRIIWPGLSADGHFLSMENAGSHSDIGGSYHIDGLSARNRNLVARYINATSEEPLLEEVPENWAPSRDVIHASHQHMFLYGTSHYRRNGERDVVGAQESAPNCRKVTFCQPPDPIDPALMSSIRDWRAVGNDPSLTVSEPEKAVAKDADQVKESIGVKPLSEAMGILDERNSSHRIEVQAFGSASPTSKEAVRTDDPRNTPVHAEASHAPVRPTMPGMDEMRLALLRDNDEAVAAIMARRQQAQLDDKRMSRGAPESHPRSDPRNERHPEHRMYESIYLQLGEMHAQIEVDLTKDQLERLASAVLVEAKRADMSSVTEMHFGQDKTGHLMPFVHIKEAFQGDLDDPRAGWAVVDAAKAINQPIEQSVQQLDDVNQNIQQQQLMREAEISQQQGMGMSMSR